MNKYAYPLFCIGLCADLLFHIYTEQSAIALINAVNIAVIIALFILFRRNTISADTSMQIMLSTSVLNTCLTMIFLAISPKQHSSFSILLAMGISFFAVLLVRLTSRRYLAVIYIVLCTSSYIFAGIKLGDTSLLYNTPTLLLLLLSTYILYSYTMALSRNIEEDKMSAEEEWKKLLNYIGLDKQQLDILRNGNPTNNDISKLISRMDEGVQEIIMQNAKAVVHDDQIIMDSLRHKHPNITAGELELCCMIVKGHTVSDISRIRGVGASTVTSTRSRLRQKISLPAKESLKSYLEAVVNNNISV